MKNKLSKVMAMALIGMSLASINTNKVEAARGSSKLPTRQEVIYRNRNKPKSKFQKTWSRAFRPLNRALDRLDRW